jgi:hypothetical protein
MLRAVGLRHLRAVLLLLLLLLLPLRAWGQATTLVNANQVVVGHINMCTTGPTSTAGNAYACTFDQAITTYTSKACYGFVADVANTGAATLNLHALGAKAITKVQGGITTPLVANDIRVGHLVRVCYDGTQMQCQNCDGNAPAAAGGVRSFNVSAGSMDVSGGCLNNDPATLVTNGPKRPTITCTDNNADSIEFDWVSPDGWDAGTITVELHAFNTAAETTAVVMHFAGQCVSSGDVVQAHSTTGEQAATLTFTNAANQEVHGTTPAITLQGSCIAGDHVYMRGQIDATGTTVANMATVKILGVKVEYLRSGSD